MMKTREVIELVEQLTKAGLEFNKHYDMDQIEYLLEIRETSGTVYKTLAEIIVDNWNDCCEPGEEIVLQEEEV